MGNVLLLLLLLMRVCVIPLLLQLLPQPPPATAPTARSHTPTFIQPLFSFAEWLPVPSICWACKKERSEQMRG
jgi:hypothetical protein